MKPQPIPSDPSPTPTHVAIIMDGNGRWARQRGLPRIAGHRKGAEAVRTTIRAAIEAGVEYLTLYGFSSENWKRPEREVNDLMGLLRFYLRNEVKALHKEGVRLRIIGDRERLEPDIVEMIVDAEETTGANTRLVVSMALSYGGRDEIVAAAKSIASDAASGALDPNGVDEDAVSSRLYTAGVPDPDLLIRTSGEKRISNFLLWQCAYAEFVFIETLWPDFSKQEFENAIREYHGRERRYGATPV